MASHASEDAAWLQSVQATWGITYANEDGEGLVRAALEGLCPDGGHLEDVHCAYRGYRQEPRPGGGFLRTELYQAEARLALPDGTAYHLALTGPYAVPLDEVTVEDHALTPSEKVTREQEG